MYDYDRIEERYDLDEKDYVEVNPDAKISSGVALNEPSVGSEESALKYAKNFINDIKSMRDQAFFFEYPINESLYPGPSIGYSKVTVKSLATDLAIQKNSSSFNPLANTYEFENQELDGFAASGVTINEFYTSRDFPTVAEETTINKSAFSDNTMIPLIGQVNLDLFAGTQGYSIELNDMHGKPKKIETFGLTEQGNIMDEAISWSEYVYQFKNEIYTPPATIDSRHRKRLISEVDIVEYDDATLLEAETKTDVELGVDRQFFNSKVDKKSRSYSVGLDMNFNFELPFLFSAFPWPSFNYSGSSLETSVSNKVISRKGIMSKAIAYDGQSRVETENRLYDQMTGSPVLTVVNNNFDDPIYSYNIPARFTYESTGPAYENIGYAFSANIVTGCNQSGNEYTISPISADFDLLRKGDEYLIYQISDTDLESPIGRAILLNSDYNIKIKGDVISGGNYNFKVMRSGKRNHLGASIASMVGLKDPTTDRREIPCSTDIPNYTFNTTQECQIHPAFQAYTDLIQTLIDDGEYDEYINDPSASGWVDDNYEYLDFSQSPFSLNESYQNYLDIINEYMIDEGKPTIQYFSVQPVPLLGGGAIEPILFGDGCGQGIIPVEFTPPNCPESYAIVEDYFASPHYCRDLLFANIYLNTDDIDDINLSINHCLLGNGSQYLPILDNGQLVSSNLLTIPAGCGSYGNYISSSGNYFGGDFNYLVRIYLGSNSLINYNPNNGNCNGGYQISLDSSDDCTAFGFINDITFGNNNSYFRKSTTSNQNLTKTLSTPCSHSSACEAITVTYSNGFTETTCDIGHGSCSIPATVMVETYDLVEGTTNIPLKFIEIDSILQSSASTMRPNWSLVESSSCVSDEDEYMDGNPYLNAEDGVWRLHETFAYVEERAQTNEVDTREDGTYILEMFNHKDPLAHLCRDRWRKVEEVLKYSSNGAALESMDALGIHSSALYGYNNHLPVAVAANAGYYEIAYEGFEEFDNLYPSSNGTREAGHITYMDASCTEQIVNELSINVYPYSFNSSQNNPFDFLILKNLSSEQANNIEDKEFSYQLSCVGAESMNLNGTILSTHKIGSTQLYLALIQYDGCNSDIQDGIFCEGANISVNVSTLNSGVNGAYQGISNLTFDDIYTHTGKQSLKVSGRTIIPQKDLNLEVGKDYIFSAWVHIADNNVFTFENLVDVAFAGNLCKSKGNIINGWQRIETRFTYDGLPVEMVLGSYTMPIDFNIDDIRVFPAEGNIQTYVYDPVDYKVTEILDNNNFFTRYSYDSEGNVTSVSKETQEGIKTIQEAGSHIRPTN